MNLQTPNILQENLLLFQETKKQLTVAKIPSAAAEAEILIRHFARQNRVEFLTGQKPIGIQARRAVKAALIKRVQRVPLGYLMGVADFFGRDFCVSRDTLIPRPETEVLLAEAFKIIDGYFHLKKPEILELGTGTGCLVVSLTIERPDCRMTALDISPKALKIASKNASFYGVKQKIRFVRSDLFGAFGRTKKEFWDLLISNPPYIASDEMKQLPKEVRREPVLALNGGKKGLDIIFRILEEAPFYLKKGGWLLMEIGKGQHRGIEQKLAKIGAYGRVEFVKDLAGIKRVLKARKK